MMICDPECTDSSRVIEWESKGFAIVSFVDDSSAGKFLQLDVKCVTPDFFSGINYDFKVKPSKFGEFNHIGSGDTPDLEKEDWLSFDEVVSAISREESDQQYKPNPPKREEVEEPSDEETVTPEYLASMRKKFEELDESEKGDENDSPEGEDFKSL